MIFYVFTGYLAKDCFWGWTFAFDDLRKELFFVDGSVGSYACEWAYPSYLLTLVTEETPGGK